MFASPSGRRLKGALGSGGQTDGPGALEIGDQKGAHGLPCSVVCMPQSRVEPAVRNNNNDTNNNSNKMK